jgi:diguanylate cyclase
VETEEVWNALLKLGCDYAQGFYNSRPMPGEQLTRWLHVMAHPAQAAQQVERAQPA